MGDYDIEEVDLAAWHSRPHPRKYWRMVELEVGQGFRVPFSDISTYSDPSHSVRSLASLYGKRLGRRFATRTLPNGSVQVVRLA